MRPEQQLEELLGDPDLLKIVHLVTREVARCWNVAESAAHGLVLSAIGEPTTLACVYDAWSSARNAGEKPRLAKVIIRRRVIDLLRKDARPSNHHSLATVATSPMETETALGALDDRFAYNPQLQLELQQAIEMVRSALACFAAQGRIQGRQAQLLQRHILDEIDYRELSAELTCSENALRVRVCKAMLALRRHVRMCHPELECLLARDRRGVIGSGIRHRPSLAPRRQAHDRDVMGIRLR